MSTTEDHLDILQNMEAAICAVFRKNPTMTDYVAQRAYEAAFERYRAEQRGHRVKPHTLSGLDAEACDAVCAVCEFRLGRAPLPGITQPPPAPVTAGGITDCLRKLAKSVKLHTERAGRQGYLTFISRFV